MEPEPGADENAQGRGEGKRSTIVAETPYYTLSFGVSQQRRMAVLMTAIAAVIVPLMLLGAVEAPNTPVRAVLVFTALLFIVIAAGNWVGYKVNERRLYGDPATKE